MISTNGVVLPLPSTPTPPRQPFLLPSFFLLAQVKTTETDGYNAVQVAYQPIKEKNVTKPMKGHFAKAGIAPLRKVIEYRLDDVSAFTVGQQLAADEMFPVGTKVDVAGKTTGKGFQGGVKRHGFARGLMSHGSKSHRQPGSIGAGMAGEGGRVLPGVKMPGQMGNTRVKVQKLTVVKVDMEKGALVVSGAVPGKPGNVVSITPAKTVGVNC